jgi:hypothetical protein
MAILTCDHESGSVFSILEFSPIIIALPISFSPAERNMGFRLKDSDSWANSPGFKSGWASLLPSGDFDDFFPDDEELKPPLTPKLEEPPFQSRLTIWTVRSAIYP